MKELKNHWGPQNPHPLSKMRTEIVWEGKYDEYGNRREIEIAGSDMPLQKVESIDEPRTSAEGTGQMDFFRKKSKRKDDFRNMLIWGDNKLVMASLLKDFKDKIDLIYIDPPFAVGADFTASVPIGSGKQTLEKDQSILEMIAYRDMWGKGIDSYLQMMAERLLLMKVLLSERGTIYVHCDWRVNHFLKQILSEVFGPENFVNDVIWTYEDIGAKAVNYFKRKHDTLLVFQRSKNRYFAVEKKPLAESTIVRYGPYFDDKGQITYRHMKETNPGVFAKLKGIPDDLDQVWLDKNAGQPLTDWWVGISPLKKGFAEYVDYVTQKPEALLERIIKASCPEEGIVADFFPGSGTTGAVAEKLGRRWIMCDLGRFAIHITRKRMIEIQRDLYNEERPYRAFDVYNLGRYERQWWQKERLAGADEEYRSIVLAFYRADKLTGSASPTLHGRKGSAFVHVDSIDSILTLTDLKPIVEATQAAGAKEVHCLAWEFEMELKRNAEALEHEYGVKVRLIRIPREVMEKNRRPGVDSVPFFEMATLSAKPIINIEGGERIADIELTNFLPSLSEVPSKELEALKERAIKSGFDFIDFWAVDFDHQDGQPFKHHWQDYRLRKDRSLKIKSDCKHKYTDTKPHTICVKVIDVFGCDTSILLEVTGAGSSPRRDK